jgi:hypothetical protein
MESMKRRWIAAWVVLLGLSLTLHAQQKEVKVLFVGNSYTYGNNLAHIVALISEGTETTLQTRKSVIGGAHLWEHWNGMRQLETKKMIAEGDFDVVVLQDYSMSGIDTPDSLLKYVGLFTEFNTQHGARTFLFNTWARKKVPQYQDQIDLAYMKAAEENGAERIPVGTAWELAMDIRPSIELFTSDGSHPNSLGTYLTACLFVKTLCGELPEELPLTLRVPDAHGELLYLFGIDLLDAEFCRRITHQVLGD